MLRAIFNQGQRYYVLIDNQTKLVFLLRDAIKDKYSGKVPNSYEASDFFNLMHGGGLGGTMNPNQLDEEMKDQQ